MRLWSGTLLAILLASLPKVPDGLGAARAQDRRQVTKMKEKSMESQWLAEQLSEHGFRLVLFQYEPAKAESLDSGPRAALNSSRVWQEQIMTPAFQLPAGPKVGIHRRRNSEPDALSFRYESGDYSVRCFHTMDRLVITLRPSQEQLARLWSSHDAVEDVASRVAGEVFPYTGRFRFQVEKRAVPMAYGGEKVPDGKNPAELFPIEMIEWWYDGNEFGFGTQKVTPVIGDRYPSSMGPSPQQVLIWFDTFGMKRYVK